MKTTVGLGTPFVLEVRFPNGRTRSHELMLVPRVPGTYRSLEATQKHYRG